MKSKTGVSSQTSLQEIESQIYLIRGHKVIFDADLARLYRVTTFNLNKAVKRNQTRFPQDFMFQLTNQELKDLVFQSGISSLATHGGRRSLPYVFTQEGVAMLSSVLRSDEAVQVNILIMRAFVRLKELSISHDDLSRRIAHLEARYDQQFSSVFEAIRELISERSIPLKRVIGLGKKDQTP
jgi:hypothetical protein